jgi:hypothetical protein
MLSRLEMLKWKDWSQIKWVVSLFAIAQAQAQAQAHTLAVTNPKDTHQLNWRLSPNFSPKPFKFFNYLVDLANFLDWVQEAWNTNVERFPMFQLYSKLKVVKWVLKKMNAEKFANISQRVFKARQKLELVQKQKFGNMSLSICLIK